MKKAYNSSEELCHFELVSKSPKTLKQVQGDNGVVRNDATKAFTLAEIMIVLSVIAVLTAVLLPAARNATPNEEVMKFRKAHNTLHTAIRELVNSDKYYLDGDLGIKTNGDLIDGSHDGDVTYFCHSLADVLNAKKVNCKDTDTAAIDEWKYALLRNQESVTEDPWDIIKTNLYYPCNKQMQEIKEEITLADGTVIFQTSPSTTFGQKSSTGGRIFLNKNNQGFFRAYKIVCVDIDGVPENATPDNCVNRCPFGYGIRYDGKILTSEPVDDWLKKEINDK